MRAGWALALIVLAFAATATAQGPPPVPAKPQVTSLDSDAPPGAPPHWLPNERWVWLHWLPYDETRLYSLLHVDRPFVWRWLRDDSRTLADLVAFTSNAWNLSPDKCNPARGIFIRDLQRATTTLVSAGDDANRFLGATRGSSAPGDMTVELVCARPAV